jgi:hypothetical protein
VTAVVVSLRVPSFQQPIAEMEEELAGADTPAYEERGKLFDFLLLRRHSLFVTVNRAPSRSLQFFASYLQFEFTSCLTNPIVGLSAGDVNDGWVSDDG